MSHAHHHALAQFRRPFATAPTTASTSITRILTTRRTTDRHNTESPAGSALLELRAQPIEPAPSQVGGPAREVQRAAVADGEVQVLVERQLEQQAVRGVLREGLAAAEKRRPSSSGTPPAPIACGVT